MNTRVAPADSSFSHIGSGKLFDESAARLFWFQAGCALGFESSGLKPVSTRSGSWTASGGDFEFIAFGSGQPTPSLRSGP